MQFKDSLKQLRFSKNIGQKQLAEAMHISVKSISHWETGYSEPSIIELIMLADFFDVSLDELVGRNYIDN